MLNFDIKCTSREDGSESVLHTMEDKLRVVESLKGNYTLESGEIVEMLELGTKMQTLFYIYEKNN